MDVKYESVPLAEKDGAKSSNNEANNEAKTPDGLRQRPGKVLKSEFTNADIQEGNYKDPKEAFEIVDNVVGKRDSITLRWENISFDVNKGSKQILQDVSGEISPGDLCAIMGPSGAGKSSLMNILAGRQRSKNGATVKGNMLVNGVKIEPTKFRNRIAYVMQEDSLFATQTAREALMFSAALRLPKSVTKADRIALVEGILGVLGLQKCANTMIGSVMIAGLSGGEKKRTAVGVELVSNPDVLFLDEPTSGLDSYAAFQVVRILQRLSAGGRTIITTIHQPSSEVFALFGSVLLLANGRLIYHDTVKGLPTYFATLGHPCPPNFNPADFIMFLMQKTTEEGVKEMSEKWSEISNKEIEVLIEDKTEGSAVSKKISTKKEKASCCTQFEYLIRREALNVIRDKKAVIARLGTTMFLNLIVGLVFMGAANWSDIGPTNLDANVKANTNFGAIVQVAISAMFGLSQPTLLAFPIERPVFLREYSGGAYGAIPYVISKMMVEIPMCLLQATLIYLITYWLVGFNGNFFGLIACTALLGLVASSSSLLVGALAKNVSVAIQLTPLLFVPQLLFAGFFIPINQIPYWLRWAQYLCSLKYAINMVTILEFALQTPSTWPYNSTESYEEVIFGCSGDNLDQTTLSCRVKGSAYEQALLPRSDIEVSSWPIYLGILLAGLVGFRLIALMTLARKAHQD